MNVLFSNLWNCRFLKIYSNDNFFFLAFAGYGAAADKAPIGMTLQHVSQYQ
jgi:hypothetical protein